MRKKGVLICAAVLAAVMMFATACGGSAKYADSKYVGKWSATKAAYMGMELGVKDILGGEFSFTLSEDGKVKLKVVDDERSGKWDETDDGIQFDGDDEMTFKEKDGSLLLDYQGMTLTFEKE